jgi:hypothetical protein
MVTILPGTPTWTKHPPVPSKNPMGMPMRLLQEFQGLHS